MWLTLRFGTSSEGGLGLGTRGWWRIDIGHQHSVTNVVFLGCEAFSYCSAGAEEADADGGFGPAVGFGDLLDFVAFKVVALQNHAIVLFASFENAADVDRGQVDLGWRGQFGEGLEKWLATHGTAMDVECDAVHPGKNHAGVAQLTEPLPASDPGGLRSFLRSIVGQPARDQKTNGQMIAPFVCASVFFACHD